VTDRIDNADAKVRRTGFRGANGLSHTVIESASIGNGGIPIRMGRQWANAFSPLITAPSDAVIVVLIIAL
jgi:hypothetical protein